MAYALLFGDMDTRIIAAGQIILCSTVPKSQFYGMSSSKYVDSIYTYVHMTHGLYITTCLPAAWLRSRSDFGQLCLNISLLHGHGDLPLCVYIYIYTYAYGTFVLFTDMVTHSNAAWQIKFWSTVLFNHNFHRLQVQDNLPWRICINVHRTQGHMTCGLLRLWSTLWENFHHLRLDICDVNVTIQKIVWDWIQFISYWYKKRYVFNTRHVFAAKLWCQCGYRSNGDRYYEVIKWYNLCLFVTVTDGHLRL